MPEQAHAAYKTPHRIAALFTAVTQAGGLGYHSLGNWSARDNNRPIEPEYLRQNLEKRGYSDAHISATLQTLMVAADSSALTAEGDETSVYQANLRIYQLLREGVRVQMTAGQGYETVHLVDWQNALHNDFAVAEDVSLCGRPEQQLDLVMYLNGIAIVVMEFKRSAVEMTEGIRQLIVHQKTARSKHFFSTVQLVVSASDTQGLRYGTIGTPEKFFVDWKESPTGCEPLAGSTLLDKPLMQMFEKNRLLELIRHFILFYAGQKKEARLHQFLGMKAAQERIQQPESFTVCTSTELDGDDGKGDGKVTLLDWKTEGRAQFDAARKALLHTSKSVPEPREIEQYLLYFCGDARHQEALLETESRRIVFNQSMASCLRTYVAIVQNLEEVGYDRLDVVALAKGMAFYCAIWTAIKIHLGEQPELYPAEVDLPSYEADMPHLIHLYIQRDAAIDLGDLRSTAFMELIPSIGIRNAIAQKLNPKGLLSKNAIAQGIISNIRQRIVRDQLTDLTHYKLISTLFEDLITQAWEDTAAYELFLGQAEALVIEMDAGIIAVVAT
ncbi:type I restriction endonuclease [Herbaspirillum sp. RTI4]|uniref:type I restriction endonuclease n=1 Tax=Herbaspirillum sp. RTI4 TaxID=3048640 RepID=UPI002AB503C6|nr:type I restriction endonuclease [Herbaspirillum sp. RTI4]MDY7579937.1 type I restriction endonuclease [Herbaspirillum sp. RTI4]MEA9983545.1 type I restriction endonuclease [Herbaspirillum sp. RTI4]